MSNTTVTFVVTVTITAGVCLWIGAVVGYSTGQRTAQYHLRAKIIAEVKSCYKLPRLAGKAVVASVRDAVRTNVARST